MSISKTMEEALNKQINAETYSAYIYMAMSANFEAMNLTGFAKWMKVQAQEELTHAMKIYGHVVERGGRVVLESVDKPPYEWKTALAAFEDAYKHEVEVTAMINSLIDLAQKEKDRAAESMLQWFVDEQVEEEATADSIVQKLRMVKEAPGALFMLDKVLGKRAFSDETKE